MREIPPLTGLPREVARPLEAIKENIEELRGRRGGKIEPLPTGASNADIINKINEILARIQG